MMHNKVLKVYAAYRSGCLGENILEAYFPFLATIIMDEHMDIVDEGVVAQKFRERYGIDLPLTFVRQVLGVGIQNGAIIESHRNYEPQFSTLKNYVINTTDFDSNWSRMRSSFGYFCKRNGIDLHNFDIDERILDALDDIDAQIVSGDDIGPIDCADIFLYAWNSYLVYISDKENIVYDFVASLSASNIMRQAIFYSNSEDANFSGLNLYLDTPMVFALLGMDVPARVDTCKYLVKKAQEAGCNIFVFDHNLREIEGIITRAAIWATSSEYSIDKANNVAKFFHDNDFPAQEVSEYCESIQDLLAELNIYIKETLYDVSSEQYQENEDTLYSMIEEQYIKNGQRIAEEKRNTISIDVRSIIMIYRERHGCVATRVQNAKDLMITINGSIANVCKKYESNQSINSGHVPACISADLFGSILWLFSPVESMQYHKKQLLASCYSFLRPSRGMLAKYVESLNYARNAGEIDEKKYLFMRSHAVVSDALMNVTRGDYARFNERTYLEVFEEITEIANQRYTDEKEAHDQTREQLKKLEEDSSSEIEILRARISSMEEKEKEQQKNTFEKKVGFWGWITTVLLVGIPYLLLLVGIEFVKTRFTDISWRSVYGIAGAIVATAIAGVLFAIGKKHCFKKVRSFLTKHCKV